MTYWHLRPLVAILILLSFLGVFASMISFSHHEIGCPFFPGQAVLCETPLQHFSHWQSSSIATGLSIFAELLAIALASLILFVLLQQERERLRFTHVVKAVRPTLFQELFSSGLLNPKIP